MSNFILPGDCATKYKITVRFHAIINKNVEIAKFAMTGYVSVSAWPLHVTLKHKINTNRPCL